jgi:hypothetical protein
MFALTEPYLYHKSKGKFARVYCMKVYGGMDLYLRHFLTLVVDGDAWAALYSGGFTPGKGRRY